MSEIMQEAIRAARKENRMYSKILQKEIDDGRKEQAKKFLDAVKEKIRGE
jgi:hypothetical protein